MSGNIVMPKLGLTMTEGTVSEWNVAIGSEVAKGDVMFSIETDKIVTEVEARDEGRILEILVAEGETVDVGVVVAKWTGPTASMDVESTNEGESAAMPEGSASVATATEVAAAGGRVRASPSAKRIAKEHGIQLENVTGTGPGGRIQQSDVELHAKGPSEQPAEPQVEEPPTVRPATRLEKYVASRLQHSKQTIPHFYVHANADLTDLLAMREKMKAEAPVEPPPSVNDFIILATARAMSAQPALNSVWQDDEILQMASVDIGMVVDTENGLHIPVLRDVSNCSVYDVARSSRALGKRARAGELDLAEMQGGTMSISNVGMFGRVSLVPIINPGQSAIIGVGAPSGIFRPDGEGKPLLRQEAPLVLSCDHRIYDGVMAAKLLAAICEDLANPEEIIGALSPAEQ